MTILSAVSAAIYTAQTLAYLPGLSIRDAIAADGGETVAVLFSFRGDCADHTMTVWVQDDALYGEW